MLYCFIHLFYLLFGEWVVLFFMGCGPCVQPSECALFMYAFSSDFDEETFSWTWSDEVKATVKLSVGPDDVQPRK